MTTSDTSSRRISTRAVVLVTLGLTVVALGVIAGVSVVKDTVERLVTIDEWACQDGEAPYTYPAGGSACAKVGSEIPDGATWEPYGNRPMTYSCHLHDDDFVRVRATDGSNLEECLPRDGDWATWSEQWERVPKDGWD